MSYYIELGINLNTAFGNTYNEDWNHQIERLKSYDTISLED